MMPLILTMYPSVNSMQINGKKEVTSHAQGKERLFLRICAVGTPNLNRTLFLLPFTTCYSRDINMSKTLMKMFSFVEAEILQGMLAFAYKGR